jgi:hypothetical protein
LVAYLSNAPVGWLASVSDVGCLVAKVGGIESLGIKKGVVYEVYIDEIAPNRSYGLRGSLCTKLCSDPCLPYSFKSIAYFEVLKGVL